MRANVPNRSKGVPTSVPNDHLRALTVNLIFIPKIGSALATAAVRCSYEGNCIRTGDPD